MPTSRITTWDELTNPIGTEVLAVDDLTTNKKLTVGNLRTGVPNGTVVVSFAGTEAVYKCNGDGASDDRAQILSALTLAVANMPAKVEFGAGDYAMSDGIELDLPDNSEGLVIIGQGAGTTKLRWHNATLINYYLLKIFSNNAKAYKTANAGAENVAIYPKDILVDGIGFVDNNPFAHQTRGNDFIGTATSGNTTTMTDTGAFTPSLFNKVSGATTFYIANTTTGAIGKIVSNTADTVTFEELVAGSSNSFSTSDGYQISCVDADNLTYGNQVEESHAITIQYCRNAHIRNCTADSIGDEAFNFSFIKQGSMTGLSTVHVPSMSFGGGALTLQHGCEDISIMNNALDAGKTYGVNTVFEGSQGINLESIDLAPIRNITISGNNIRGQGDAGINMNSSFAGTTISQISITGNTIANCGFGIARLGSQPLTEVSVVSNAISDITGYGVNIDGAISQTSEWVITDNTFVDCTAGGMQLNMSNSLLSNNVYKSCSRGIFIFNGADINISSGVFIGCGGTLQEEIEDTSPTSSSSCSNIIIEDSKATSSHIKGVRHVSNVTLKNSVQATQRQVAIYNPYSVSNCVLDGGIFIASTENGGNISGNSITYTDGGPTNTGVAIDIPAGADDWVVTGNHIDLSSCVNNQACIRTAGDNGVITGNRLKSLIAGQTNALVVTGTGNLYETATNADPLNKTT